MSQSENWYSKQVLVIPDIHNKVDRAQAIIDRHIKDCDEVFLLGDIMDDYDDSAKDIYKNVQWLSEIFQDRRIRVILGNHEASYIHKSMRCSGWHPTKQFILDEAVYTGKFKWHYFVPSILQGGVLYTHAGVSTGVHYMYQHNLVKKLLTHQQYDEHINAHRKDGGELDPAGILWARPHYNPVSKNEGFQIFGHTPHTIPKQEKHYLCLDTNLNHYAIVEYGLNDVSSVKMEKVNVLEY